MVNARVEFQRRPRPLLVLAIATPTLLVGVVSASLALSGTLPPIPLLVWLITVAIVGGVPAGVASVRASELKNGIPPIHTMGRSVLSLAPSLVAIFALIVWSLGTDAPLFWVCLLAFAGCVPSVVAIILVRSGKVTRGRTFRAPP